MYPSLISKMTSATAALAFAFLLALPVGALAQDQGPDQPVHAAGGEANLRLPDNLDQVEMLGMPATTLLYAGLGVCLLGFLFGMVIFVQLRNLPVHQSMREISELIYETCKTYMITQGKFILLLEVFIGAIIVLYFGFLLHFEASRVFIILLFSLIGIEIGRAHV